MSVHLITFMFVKRNSVRPISLTYHTATYFVLVFAVLYTSCHCHKPAKKIWYLEPCDAKTPSVHPTTRHGRSAVATELNTIINRINEEYKKLLKLYDRFNVKRNLRKIKILNKREMKLIRQANTTQMYKPLFRALQKYGKILEALGNRPVKPEIQFKHGARRKEIFDNVIGTLKVYMCEVHDRLHKKPFRDPKVKTIKQEVNFTQFQKDDIKFFQQLRCLFKQILESTKKNVKRTKRKCVF